VYGDVIVEIERGDGLDTGMFRVTAEVYTGGDVPPMQSYEQPPARPAGPRLRLVDGGGRQFPLGVGSTVIGRGDQTHLRLLDVGMSRRHARLDYDGTQVVLTDLGSTNGTTVNGQRISAVALNAGDLIQLGTTTLRLEAYQEPWW
jgi:hypothetical protein